ncbi:type II toxin-antitoxin system VapC family toxin [Candidatus Poriferisodalis sp.]|uniref:type II toxin-antitoxin system VapC family toxin n=1 Tax=Candidatus Poriferisodalis sp. TaxID=3101277 RepID=UPI003B02CB64
MIVDTSVLLAALVPDQQLHASCRALLSAARSMVVSPLVLAEIDYFAARIAGVDAELAILDELGSGMFELAPFERVDLIRARAVIERYRDLRLGLTDASLVVLAHRHGTHEIATLDERHFRVVRSLTGQAFTLLPADLPE